MADFGQNKVAAPYLHKFDINFDKGRQGGQGWHCVIVVSGSHGEGVFYVREEGDLS